MTTDHELKRIFLSIFRTVIIAAIPVFIASSAGAAEFQIAFSGNLIEMINGNEVLGSAVTGDVLYDGSSFAVYPNGGSVIYDAFTPVEVEYLLQGALTKFSIDAAQDFQEMEVSNKATSGGAEFYPSATYWSFYAGNAGYAQVGPRIGFLVVDSTAYSVPDPDAEREQFISNISDPSTTAFTLSEMTPCDYSGLTTQLCGTLSVIDKYGASYSVSLSSISVSPLSSIGASPAPEPSSWTIIIFGIALAGSVLRYTRLACPSREAKGFRSE